MNNILYDIWLSHILPAGSPLIKQLMMDFGAAEAVYHAVGSDFNKYRADDFASDVRALENKDLSLAERSLNYCKTHHIGLVSYFDEYYPERLRIIKNPPVMLYALGHMEKLDTLPLFAMVGTRSCSVDGYKNAYRIAYNTAFRGGCIASGLALGIDEACTTACLDAGSYAVGVLGCGIDRVYPPGNEKLFERISQSGLILTEFPPFTKPNGYHFPIRNRIISAVTIAACLFEAPAHSGAAITADITCGQGKHVFAVPGDIDDERYEEPLRFIKDGAAILTSAEDILTTYSLKYPTQLFPEKRGTLDERKIEAAVKDAQMTNPYMVGSSVKKEPIKRAAKRFNKKKDDLAFLTEEEKTSAQKAVAAESGTAKETAVTENAEQAAGKPFPYKDISALSAPEQAIYSAFEHHPVLTFDEIVSRGVSADDAMASLTLLEVYGYIESIPGGRYKVCLN